MLFSELVSQPSKAGEGGARVFGVLPDGRHRHEAHQAQTFAAVARGEVILPAEVQAGLAAESACARNLGARL